MVLVAEDEALVRLFAVDLLEDAGFEVIETRNTQEALDALRAHPGVGALFTDIEMPPGRDGLALAHAVGREWPHLPVLIGSGRYRPRADQLPAGARFVAKPYMPSVVVGILREMVGASRAPHG